MSPPLHLPDHAARAHPAPTLRDEAKRFSYQVVEVNAQYSTQVSDHDPQVVDLTP